MQNIEFKAELRDLEAARAQCRTLPATPVGRVRQVDTYYRLADGRLKRRVTDGDSAEWIFYHRPNRVAPKLCNYSLLTDAEARRRWGTVNLREWLTITKTREMWMHHNVRIHLDEVADLGTFIEFEAIVTPRVDTATCQQLVSDLRQAFAPVLGEPVAVGYSDLMA